MMVRVGGCALSLLLILYTVGCSGQYCPASDRLIVYDVAFDNCSVTINWKSPVECSSPVLRYVVKYAKDCPDNNGWKNVTLDRNKTSVVLHDEQFVMACFIGKCYFQVIAEVLNCHSTPFQIFSSCVRISESYHESMPLYNALQRGQEMCIPFRVCPDLILPTFIVNNTVIPISGDRQDAYYISEGKFCFSKLQTNMILYETCVTQSTCSVCSNYTGEMVIMSRSQLTVLTSESDDHHAAANNANEWCNIPAVTFCNYDGNSYTLSDTEVTSICICTLFMSNAQTDLSTAKVSLYEDQCDYSSSKLEFLPNTLTLSSNSRAQQCIEIELLDCVKNNTYISVCLKNNSTRNLIYLPEPCIQIQVLSNITDECTTTTLKPTVNTLRLYKVTISIPVSVVLVILVGLFFTGICVKRRYSKKKKSCNIETKE